MFRHRLDVLLLAFAMFPVAPFAWSGEAGHRFLDGLEGSWSFELVPNGSEQATVTGARTFSPIDPGHPSLAWRETFDGREVVVTGIIGYDTERERYFETGSAQAGPVEVWFGTPEDDGRIIRWHDALHPEAPEMGRFVRHHEDRFDFEGPRFRVTFRRR